MVQWVLAAWDTISVEVIVRSFAACGITTSNPNDIHCVKSGGIASDAYSEVLMIHQSDEQALEEGTEGIGESDTGSDLFSDLDDDVDAD